MFTSSCKSIPFDDKGIIKKYNYKENDNYKERVFDYIINERNISMKSFYKTQKL